MTVCCGFWGFIRYDVSGVAAASINTLARLRLFARRRRRHVICRDFPRAAMKSPKIDVKAAIAVLTAHRMAPDSFGDAIFRAELGTPDVTAAITIVATHRMAPKNLGDAILNALNARTTQRRFETIATVANFCHFSVVMKATCFHVCLIPCGMTRCYPNI